MTNLTENQTWREQMTVVAILYLIAECNKKIPLDVSLLADEDESLSEIHDLSFLKSTMADMHKRDFVSIEGKYWVVTAEGKQVLNKIVEMFDHARKLEIFSGVRLTRALTEAEYQPDDEFLVTDDIYDPRFLGPDEEDEEAEDLRIAMFTFMAEEAEGDHAIDPHRIVFIQKLIDNELRSPTFFFDLLVGVFFDNIEAIVSSAYQWRDIGEDDDHSAELMGALYTAGMLETRKREGNECSACGIPLSVFEILAKEEGRELTSCPSCGQSYEPQTVTVMEDVYEPAEYEDVVETVYEDVEDVYDDDYYYGYSDPWLDYDAYDYEPYGYYDPWDPVGDVAFLCLCAALW